MTYSIILSLCRLKIFFSPSWLHRNIKVYWSSVHFSSMQLKLAVSVSELTTLPEQRDGSHPGERAADISQPNSPESLRTTAKLAACRSALVSGC